MKILALLTGIFGNICFKKNSNEKWREKIPFNSIEFL